MYYFKAEQMAAGYDGKPVVKDIEIRIKKGEILTLIGPNGAGKSTILKSIAKQLRLIGGVVSIDNKEISLMSGEELSKKIAVVFTERLRAKMMTCEDVVATGRYPYTGRFGILSKKDHAAVFEAMELVHVTGIRDCDFAKISDGQRQRVMLARAVCQESELIILDEPTSFLDIRYKLEFLSVLQELRKKRELTVIMSLHELELANRVSDLILCVNGEYVEKFGRPDEIFKSGYIKSLFGIETGRFDEENGSMELEPPKKKAGIFVIGGAGSARETYRRLQRQGEAFITGILHENDMDFPVAKALSERVLSAEAFEPVDRILVDEAKKEIDLCRKVICCRETFGSLDFANKELFEYAAGIGKMRGMV